MENLSAYLTKAGAVAAASASIVGLWLLFGLPTVATSEDVTRLESQQIDTAVEVYQQKKRALILDGAAIDREQKAIQTPSVKLDDAAKINAEELNDTNQKLHDLRSRQIELSK